MEVLINLFLRKSLLGLAQSQLSIFSPPLVPGLGAHLRQWVSLCPRTPQLQEWSLGAIGSQYNLEKP